MTGWIVFWAALAVVFAGGEAFTRSWRLWPFAAAGALGATAAACGVSVSLQWALFALAAALLPFVASRIVRGRR